jgi:malonyl CoA-acyl carrier protein transacylase
MRVEFDRSRAAVVLPGQSSRDEGMRELVEEWRPELLGTLYAATDADDPFTDDNRSLAAEQAVTVCSSLAYWHQLGRPSPRYVVGHSLGELTALAVAGSIGEHDAIRLAANRGELMQRACEANPGCGMVAARAPLFDVEPIAEACDVAVAYHNAPRQVVLSGGREALRRVREALRDEGIRCSRVDPCGAFNSPLMAPAVEPFRRALEECEVRPPQAIVYSASTCRPLIDVRGELARNLTSGVRWWETLARLAMEGVETFIEVRASGLLSQLPAGIVTERESPPARARETAFVASAVAAAEPAADDGSSVDALYAYHDEQNRLHVLV